MSDSVLPVSNGDTGIVEWSFTLGNTVETGLFILLCVVAWAIYKWVRGQPWGKEE